MMSAVVIIGGGVSGLYAAIECARLGLKVIVLEGGKYPSHKVCGEFISAESLPLLLELGIQPIPIEKATFHCGDELFTFPFPISAGGLSHLILDPLLVECARSLGVDIQTEARVKTLYPKKSKSENHEVHLSDGQVLSCSSVVIATGKIPSFSQFTMQPKYMGIKAHFSGVSLNHTLEMFSFQGAYLGLSPIEEGKVNLACLASQEKVRTAGSPGKLMNALIGENERLEELMTNGEMLFDEWMSTPVPSFGFKLTPNWLDAYFIGDAAMSIPPACGGGLSLAISTGHLAAQYLKIKDPVGFKKRCRLQFKSQMVVAKGLHHLMMRPTLNKMALKCCSMFPRIADKLYSASRQKCRDYHR